MALKISDFQLTQNQLDQINRYISDQAKAHAEAGEDPACGVQIIFEWAPGFGRFIDVKFDGEIEGMSLDE